MQKRIPIKNPHQEIQLILNRSIFALFMIGVLICLLIFRLAYLQLFKNEMYTTLATQNWLELVPIEPTRGLVYDRNGVLLAENIPVYSLDVTPDKVVNMSKTLSYLKKIITLSESDVMQFQRQLKQHRRFDEIPLKLRLTEEEVARFAENQHLYPGVEIKARLMRHYPFGESFSHVLGYVGRISTEELDEIDQTNYSGSHYIGKSGIEKYYEEELHGTVGYEEVENDASSRPVRTLKEIKSTPGKNIYLTIDSGLQLAAEKALDGHRGAIVAIQPSTGQVLAMVSEPGFDPNLFVTGINLNDYQALRNSPDRPLYNRALRGLYPPASTVKPYLALEGLNSGIVSPEDTISDPGWFELRTGSHRFYDWQSRGHGIVNLNTAIMRSCDTYFFTLGVKMGIRRIDQILSKFGYGAPTGIDLDDELSGVVASPDWKRKSKGMKWFDGDTVNASIGQGYLQATPLQLAHAVSILANRGVRYLPYLMLGEQMPGKSYSQQQPTPLEPVVLEDKEAWNDVINGMKDVVNQPLGTAFALGRGHTSYTVAGKTGTAQVIAKRGDHSKKVNQNDLPERYRDHHLFIAFAPVDHPQIALAIITENSYNTLQATRAILDYYLGKNQNATGTSQTETKKTSA